MNPTDILLSIAIVGIYTQIYIYLKTNYKKQNDIIDTFQHKCNIYIKKMD